MWLYLGIAATCVGSTLLYFRNKLSPVKVLRNAPDWTNKMITNQLAKKLIEMHHKYYIVWYPYGLTWYKIYIPRNRKPTLIDQIYDQNSENVTVEVKQFMGPSHNFHGQRMTPKMMGYEQLRFTTIDDDDFTFSENEVIQFN